MFTSLVGPTKISGLDSAIVAAWRSYGRPACQLPTSGLDDPRNPSYGRDLLRRRDELLATLPHLRYGPYQLAPYPPEGDLFHPDRMPILDTPPDNIVEQVRGSRRQCRPGRCDRWPARPPSSTWAASRWSARRGKLSHHRFARYQKRAVVAPPSRFGSDNCHPPPI
jgi:hypothetical protein